MLWVVVVFLIEVGRVVLMRVVVVLMVIVRSFRWMADRADDDCRIPNKVDEEKACTSWLRSVGGGRVVEF